MKKYIYVSFIVMLFACGGSEDNPIIEPPVAVNDTATTVENTPVTIDVLSNDTLKNNATLNDFSSASANNGLVREISNKLIYTPADNFIGTDTFTYTICDGLSTPNCATATVTVTVTDVGNPVAVDDAFDIVENTTNTFEILINDTLVDGALLSSINNALTNGTVILNNDNTITYTAPNGFSGEDTFTYTICDTDATPSCATATVTFNVTDEGNPTAVDDAITVVKNQVTSINEILDNDTLIDDTVLSSINDSASSGTLILNNNGTLTYEPATDFVGEDTFTYTICDDDAPTNTCATATVTISVITPVSFNIPASLTDYYSGVVFTEDSNLMKNEIELVTKSKHTTILTYAQRHQYLYNADEDLNNADNVILMYSSESRYWEEYTSGTNSYSPQTFNTEHVYPQSRLVAADAVTDLHHLRSCDATVNSDRLNYPFTDGSGIYKLVGESWFPGDEWKGDVARMILYLNIRYGETFSKVGSLELFLKWNREDPVSAFEEQRNTVIFSAQGNRNPFIDNPYLATLIWGGEAAENKWQ
jgi:endonuclease I/dihydroxyacetone kinase DhaKLM complex PTS-EIIA-like component DhaM